MTDRKGDKPEGKPKSLLGTAFRTGVKAWSSASSALKSQPAKRIRGGLKNVAVGIAGKGDGGGAVLPEHPGR